MTGLLNAQNAGSLIHPQVRPTGAFAEVYTICAFSRLRVTARGDAPGFMEIQRLSGVAC